MPNLSLLAFLRRQFPIVAALLSAAAWPCVAQPAGNSGSASAPRHDNETVDVLDVHSIDPHDFRAFAVRIPEGAAPAIDGRLDDDAWQLAPTFGNFVQREPVVGARSTERTEFRVLYDDAKIYFAIWAFESHPGGIVASEMVRDSGLRKGDAVRIVLDTFHDHRNCFYFSTNPLGAQKDGHASDNGRMNWEWNAVWEVKTTRDERGWYSEFAIPLSQLRFNGQPAEQVWGFNVGRIIIHKREEVHFVPFPREWQAPGIFRIAGAGLLGGLHDLKPRRRLELIPFLAPQVARDFDAGTPTRWNRNYGMDLRMSLTPTLNADFTYRTDFAQVEADQEVVNLTRFSLFFPERRQFFTESASTFSYGRLGDEAALTNAAGFGPGLRSLFYSRRIGLSNDGREVPIIGGARVTGNLGSYTVGLMNVATDEADHDVGGRAVHIPKANYMVARVKRNVLKSSTVGAIALNRQGVVGSSAYNRALGVDGAFTLSNSLRIVSLLAKTFSPGVRDRDMAGVLDVAWTTDRFGAGAAYTDIQEHFNAEMGFIPRVDIRHSRLNASWTPRPNWPGVRQLTFGGSTDYFEDHQGTPQSRTRDVSFTLMRHDRSSFRASLSNDYDLLPSPLSIGPHTIRTGGYSWNTASSSFSTNDSRRIYGGGGVDVGEYYSGYRRTFRANINFLPKTTLLVENSYTRNHVTIGSTPYVTNTLSTRVSYSFSPALFMKAFVQYNDDRRVANLNLLLWSIYRPGSDFYIVYNEGFDTRLPGVRPLRVRSRQLAVKLSYWLSR